ncbi:MAG: hypothetical protein R3C43_19750 [Chloroflexota bacterium]
MAAAASEDFRTASIRFAPTEVETAREMTDHLRLGRRRAHVEAILETFPVTAKQAVHRPWTDLMIQLSRASAPAVSGAADEIETLGHYVRSAARVGPLVITIDNLDWAPGYWIDLLPRLAREIALELPVLLLVSLESPAPLAELDGPRHTEPTRLGQKLVAEGTPRHAFSARLRRHRTLYPTGGRRTGRPAAVFSRRRPQNGRIALAGMAGSGRGRARRRRSLGRDGGDERWWCSAMGPCPSPGRDARRLGRPPPFTRRRPRPR